MKPQTSFCRLKAYGEFNLNPMEVQSHKELGLIYRFYAVATLQNLSSFFMFNDSTAFWDYVASIWWLIEHLKYLVTW